MEIIFAVVICFFALYGILQLLLCCIKRTKKVMLAGECEIYTLLTVRNQQDTVEGVVRALAWERSNNSVDGKDILIADMGSKDDTCEIIARLAGEYGFVHIIDNEFLNKDKWSCNIFK